LTAFLGSSRRAGLIPAAALLDENSYYETLKEQLIAISPTIFGDIVQVRWSESWHAVLDTIDSVIVPGGNTFALLMKLRQSGLLTAISERIHAGLPYVGSSAGANIVGPNILTTNDWNVVGASEFNALGLVQFNINPHYSDETSPATPYGQTRDDHIHEYHQIWANPVVALEESAVLRVVDNEASLLGRGRAKVFLRDRRELWFGSGQVLDLE
jgi:dipeptidase E